MADKGKSEAPTPRRKKDSRRKGQVAKSPDLVAWAQLYVFSMMVPKTIGRTVDVLNGLFEKLGAVAADPQPARAMAVLGGALTQSMLALVPVIGGLTMVGVVGNFAQTGLLFSSHGLKPKMDRLNPMKGLKKMMSPASVWEAGKTSLRTSLLAGVALPQIDNVGKAIIERGNPSASVVFGDIAGACSGVLRHVAMGGLGLAALDYLFQKRRLLKSIKMTKQEVRDENRQTDGDPQMKAEIKSRQLSMSRNRMMSQVGTATAVIVNPTHVAVAIRYAPSSGAPVVVAKGKGAVAQRIRELAAEHRVPIVQDVPLARALHAACDLGQEIPLQLYEAVARILALLLAHR